MNDTIRFSLSVSHCALQLTTRCEICLRNGAWIAQPTQEQDSAFVL